MKGLVQVAFRVLVAISKGAFSSSAQGSMDVEATRSYLLFKVDDEADSDLGAVGPAIFGSVPSVSHEIAVRKKRRAVQGGRHEK